VCYKGWSGNSYQIVDRNGQLVYPEPQSVWPAFNSRHTYYPKVKADGEGGAIIYWVMNSLPDTGVYAQRLDSLGNIMWGDSAKKIYPLSEQGIDICPDGNGGFYFAVSYLPDEPGSSVDIWLQHIDSEGQTAWSDSGKLVLSSPHDEGSPRLVPDGEGGVYMVWIDSRIPNGSVFMQRFDSLGQAMWDPAGGLVIYENNPWTHEIIPDGENGFILHAGSGSGNRAYRVGPNGDILWHQHYVSWNDMNQMVPGEPGYFYLGWIDDLEQNGWRTVYGQRMDMDGNLYWPTYGSGHVGAEMAHFDNLVWGWESHFAFRYPYFFGIYMFKVPTVPTPRGMFLYIQALDIRGDKQFGDNGTLLTYLEESSNSTFLYPGVIPDDEGGAAGIFGIKTGPDIWDIYGKHVNADGTLGGPDPRKRPAEIYPQISGVSNGLVQFTLPEAGWVEIDLYNLLGRRIGVIGEGHYAAGSHAATYDLRDLTSGVYFVRLKTGYGQAVKKVVIIR
jgi:hypothetical protein